MRRADRSRDQVVRLFDRALGFWKRAVAINFKLFLTFFQMILLFRYVYLITYPDAYLEFLSVFSVFSFNLFDLLHLKCVFGHVDFIAQMYTTGFLALCMVLAIVAIMIFERTDQTASATTHERLRLTQRVLNLVVFVTYPFVCSMLFQVHNCRTVDRLAYLHADYSVVCHNAKHRSAVIFSGFVIAVVAIGTPLLYMTLLFPHRDEIRSLMSRSSSNASSRHLRFFFGDYKPQWWYWEAVVCTLKLTITGFAVWFAPGSMFQTVIGMLVLLMYSILLMQCKPYLSPLHNSLAVFQSVAVFLSLLAALLLKIGEVPDVDLGYSSNFVTGALIATAAALLVSTVLSGIRDSQLAIVKVVVSTSETSWPPESKQEYKVGAVVRTKWDGGTAKMAEVVERKGDEYRLRLVHSDGTKTNERDSVPVDDMRGENMGEVQPIMRIVELLCRRRGDMIFGYDWAGSKTADLRDRVACMCRVTETQNGASAGTVGGEIDWGKKDSVADSYWFKGYCDALRGEIKTLSQMPQVKTLRLICIRGGPITQLEEKTIRAVVKETKEDLQTKEVEADTVSRSLPSIFRIICTASRRDARSMLVSAAMRTAQGCSVRSTSTTTMLTCHTSHHSKKCTSNLGRAKQLPRKCIVSFGALVPATRPRLLRARPIHAQMKRRRVRHPLRCLTTRVATQ
jgi:hypothetical protein